MEKNLIDSLGHRDTERMFLILADERAFLDEELRGQIIQRLQNGKVKLAFNFEVYGDESPRIQDEVGPKDLETVALIIPLPCQCVVRARVMTDIEGINRIGEISINCH